MTIWLYRLLVACVALFTVTPAIRHDKDDQPGTLNVHIRDYCDPVTFAAIGCNRTTTPVSDGFITLSGFQAELGAEKSVGAWRFIPSQVQSEQDLTLALQNLGGETHTFTRVRNFGGGFIGALNAASGNPIPAPECARMVNGQLVPQPPSADNVFLPGSTNANGPQVREGEFARFQCCIHPWMRVTINTKEHSE